MIDFTTGCNKFWHIMILLMCSLHNGHLLHIYILRLVRSQDKLFNFDFFKFMFHYKCGQANKILALMANVLSHLSNMFTDLFSWE